MFSKLNPKQVETATAQLNMVAEKVLMVVNKYKKIKWHFMTKSGSLIPGNAPVCLGICPTILPFSLPKLFLICKSPGNGI